MPRVVFFFLFYLAIEFNQCFAQTIKHPNKLLQDSIDNEEELVSNALENTLIQLIKEYELLLNTIASTGLNSEERKKIISNSYLPSSSLQLFLNENVIIETDIDPLLANEPVRDNNVKKYLQDFNLFYSKSEKPTVHFNYITVSERLNNELIKINFESEFSGTHVINGLGYPIKNRSALVKLIHDPVNKWKPLIAEIDFDTGTKKPEKEFEQIPISQVEIKWNDKAIENKLAYYEIYMDGIYLGSTIDTSYLIPVSQKGSLEQIKILKKYGSLNNTDGNSLPTSSTIEPLSDQQKNIKTKKVLISVGAITGFLTALIITIGPRV